MVTAPADGRVSPFGHRGINACVPLPRAFRSLPRPSSPLCAQASPTYLRSLDSFPADPPFRAILWCKSFKQSTRYFERVMRSQKPHTFHGTRNRYYASLRFFVLAATHTRVGLSTAAYAGRSTHDHFPLPLSNSGATPQSSATNPAEIANGRGGRQNPGLSADPPKRPSTHRSGKEVIQPQVPLRLPCYDFAPVIALALGGLVPCGFRHRLRALTTSMA